MSRTRHRMRKSVISAVLAFILAFSMTIPAFAYTLEDSTGDGSIKYVSLGASNTNGYGLRGYIDGDMDAAALDSGIKNNANVLGYNVETPGSYPVLIAKELQVDLDQLAISSMRAEELRILLDNEYYGDAYSNWRFVGEGKWFDIAKSGGLDELRADYQDKISNADLITVDIGVNNFGVYVSYQMTDGYSLDEDLAKIDPALAEEYEAGKAYVKGLIAQNYPEYAQHLTGMDDFVDTLAYALVGFCVNFDAVMERIYELNPDATVVAVSIQNLMDGLYMSVPGTEETLPLGDLFAALVNAANVYIAGGSPYSDQYLCADVRQDGRVEFFLDDLLAYNGNPETLSTNIIDCFDVYDGMPGEAYDKGLHVKYLLHEYLNDNWGTILESLVDTAAETLAGQFGDFDTFMNAGEGGFSDVVDEATQEQLLALYAQLEEAYDKMLYAAYDVVASILQAGAQANVVDLSALSAMGDIEDELMEAITTQLETAVQSAMSGTPDDYVLPDNFFDAVADAVGAGVDADAVKTVASLAVRTSIGNSFFGHPNPNGHKEVSDAIIAALDEGTTGKDILVDELLIAVDGLEQFISENYEEIYKNLYEYAKQEGYIADIAEGIEEVIVALGNIDLSGIEVTDDLKAELKATLEEAVKTLEAAKDLILNAPALDDLETIEKFNILMEQAATTIAKAEDMLDQAGVEANEAIALKLQEARDYLATDVLPKIEAAIGKALTDALIQLESDVIDALENIEDVIEDLEGKYAGDIKEAYASFEGAVKPIISDLKDAILEGKTDRAVDLLEELEGAIADFATALEPIGGAVAENIKTELEALEKAIDEAVEAAKVNIEAVYEAATTGELEITCEPTKYIAIGDATIAGDKSYDELLNAYLNGEIDSLLGDDAKYDVDYEALQGGLAQDILANLKAGAWIEDIKDADLITVSMGQENLTTDINEQLVAIIEEFVGSQSDGVYNSVVNPGWASIVGEEGEAAIVKAVDKITEELAANVADEAVVKMVLDVIEAYAYGYTSFAVSHYEALNAIQEQAPDAEIVVVGLNNPFAGVVLDFGDFAVDLGEYADYVVKAADLQLLLYAMIDGGENVTFVSAPDAATNAKQPVADLMDALSAYSAGESGWIGKLTDAYGSFLSTSNWMPNDEGQDYILEQIKAAVELTVAGHDNSGEWKHDEANHWKFCGICEEEIEKAGHVLVDADVNGDGVLDKECECGYQVVSTESDGGDEGGTIVAPDDPDGSDVPAYTLFPDVAAEVAEKGVDGVYYVRDGALDFVVEKGLMRGYDFAPFNYGPYDNLTRGQAAVIFWRYYQPEAEAAYAAEGAVNETGISDVLDGKYYTGAVNWCVENGVMNGYIDQSTGEAYAFGPNDPITREQLCSIIANAAEKFNGAKPGSASLSAVDSMPDGKSVSGWAKQNVAWALEAGVINGVEKADGTRVIAPQRIVDRAQMTCFLFNTMSEGIL